MSTGLGAVAIGLGIYGLGAACVRALLNQRDLSFQDEVCALLWFILAAVVLK